MSNLRTKFCLSATLHSCHRENHVVVFVREDTDCLTLRCAPRVGGKFSSYDFRQRDKNLTMYLNKQLNAGKSSVDDRESFQMTKILHSVSHSKSLKW